ncbi:phosphoribosylformylglycinamidine synthase [Candidatus Woesearchaeota archaeon]|nr:phosphoribosylformylglycinamidine synthase [Candidatus Woesearchaeota archaeon]
MADPRVLVLAGYGINCEKETAYAFSRAGAKEKHVSIVHINDIISGDESLGKYQILAFPGGFSWGDDTGAGNALANKVSNNMWAQVYDFVQNEDHLGIGICNGFQALTNLGLVPALDRKYGEVEVELKHNDSARFRDRWVDLRAEGNSPWLRGIDQIAMPVRHGEGRFFAEPEVLKAIEGAGQVALRYNHGSICDFLSYDANPNGSLNDIAGITDPSGRILGLMPHPEAAIDIRQDPRYTHIREQCMRSGVELPKEGPGLQVFRNAVDYCRK